MGKIRRDEIWQDEPDDEVSSKFTSVWKYRICRCSGALRKELILEHYFQTCVALADRGGVPGARPLQDPVLSFSHTFLAKSARIGGPQPHLIGPHPPYGKSWIRHCVESTFMIKYNIYALQVAK